MKWLYLSLILFLTACASGPRGTAPEPVEWREHQRQLQAMNNWRAQGKVALRLPDRLESASLNWSQSGQRSELVLSGPLGAGATTIVAGDGKLEIRRGDELKQVDASSPETVQRETGWPLPVAELPYWLRGIPAPGEVDRELLEGGLLRQLQQAGWMVEYSAYGDFAGTQLPTKLTLDNGEISARVLLRQWHTP